MPDEEKQAGTTVVEESSEESAEVKQSEVAPASEETFLDPSALPDEVKPIYKKMQAAFTKKMQRLSEDAKKIEAFDAFNADPVGNIKAVAGRFGLNVVEKGQETSQKEETAEEWVKRVVMETIQSQMSPMAQKVGKIEEATYKTYLDTFYPDWYDYEDEMVSILKKHPTLKNDIDRLYTLATADKTETKAYQKMVKSMKQKKEDIVESKKSSGSEVEEGDVNKRMTLREAMELAKRKI